MATDPAVLQSLAADLALEHAAIYQYIVQAGQLRDTALAGRVMESAREEMTHMDWLMEAISDRGGVPTADRADVFLSASPKAGLLADVRAEDMALQHYTRTLEIVGQGDPDLRSLIERIIDDERHHRDDFRAMTAAVEREGEAAFVAAPRVPPSDVPALGQMIGLEYEGLLRYIWNRHAARGDCELADTFFDLAIEEMRHGAWTSECMAGLGEPQQPPQMTDRVVPLGGPAQARESAVAFEERARAEYASIVGRLSASAARSAAIRAAFQHDYRVSVLSDGR
jgi:rubrerythrin